jgi:hypothetical protein
MPARARSSRTYSTPHRAQRKRMIPLAIGTWCPVRLPVCEGIMVNPSRMDLGHIVPLWAGGSDSIENKQVECLPCNRSKGATEGNRLRRPRGSRDW